MSGNLLENYRVQLKLPQLVKQAIAEAVFPKLRVIHAAIFFLQVAPQRLHQIVDGIIQCGSFGLYWLLALEPLLHEAYIPEKT